MEWLAKTVSSITEKILVALLTAMTLIVFAQVVFRYVLRSPLYWSEEAARYIMIWIVFLGASIGIRKASHLGFTWYVERSSLRIRRICALIAHLGLLAFSLNITYYGSIITLNNTDQLSPGLQMPIAFVYACLPVGGILCIIQLIPILVKLSSQKTAQVTTRS
jgi:TRAP-type C4-dicarboxylate transport system permease small subunit